MLTALKASLPRSLRVGTAGVIVYARRMAVWASVLRFVRGRTSADGAVLRRSALVAPADMLRDLDRWRNPVLIADAEVRVAGLGVFSIRARSDDLYHVIPSIHAGIFRAIASRLIRGSVAIDAGANIGAITILMATGVAPRGRVIAVEMMPDTAAVLRRNIALNRLEDVTVVERALSSRGGEIATAAVAERLFGQASITQKANSGGGTRSVSVMTTTLDTIAEDVPEISVLKMDLEGAEAMALAGACEMLKRTLAVVFESWAPDGGDAARLLAEAGFEILAIDGRNFLATRNGRA